MKAQRKRDNVLISNKESGSEMVAAGEIQRLTINLLPNNCRFETLENRQHTVIPMVILLEGVHAGSDGPLFYASDELSKTPQVWNHKPIVVYHPEINGQGVSACDPVILNNRKVGIMMNTKWDGKLKRLTSEAWIEPERANAVDERVMAAVTGNQMMELSTGLFVDVEKAPGEFTGTRGKESYTGIARNFRPDHLALLPDKVGACSIADGAGFLRNEARRAGNNKEALQAVFNHFLEWSGIGSAPTDNEMSFGTIRESLSDALRKKFGVNNNTPNGPMLWVEEVFSNFVIYEHKGKQFRIGYSASDVDVTLSDEAPVEVKRVIEYRTVDGAKFVGNLDQTEGNNMNKKAQMIVAILAANAGWADKDKPVLEAMSDQQIEVIHNGVKPATPPASPTPPSTPTPPAETKVEGKEAPKNNEEKKFTLPEFKTVDDFIAFAPPGMREVLHNSMDSLNKERTDLVGKVVANKDNEYTKEELEAMPIGNLRKLAKLATIPAPVTPVGNGGARFNYGGQAPVTDNNSKKEEVLALPVMNFEKK